jgi:cytochrome c oxidase cbb3-type subunit 2
MGCAQCHTQVIRPNYIGVDQYKKNWGAEQGAKGMPETRASTAYDFLGEDFAMIGQRRVGPDLTNAGYRFNSSLEVYQMLYSPRLRRPWSNHPTYPSLFNVADIESEPRIDAITDGTYSVPAGKQIVPTSDAKALAEYLLALKRDLPLPMSISGKSIADKKPAK